MRARSVLIRSALVGVIVVLAMMPSSLSAQSYEQRIAASMRRIDDEIKKGPYQASWNSLERYQIPEWYQDAKFGIFIHWGLYSVAAFDNEWYSRNMYQPDSVAFKHHIATYGPQTKFGYKDFIPLLTAEKFDANVWAELFRRAGAKYVVPVAEHHDGFPMYDCSFTEWSAAKMGPRRDLVGELAAAVRRHGLHFGLSSHRAEHWWFFDGGRKFDSDVTDPRYASFYGPAQSDKTPPDSAFLNDWLARSAELVDRYQPEVFYFDWWIKEPAFEPYRQKFAAYYYDRAAQAKRGVVLNYKENSFPEKAAVLDVERGQLGDIRPLFWQTDTSISYKSWGYLESDDLKSPELLVQQLVDIVSKNGGMMLNIGPRADGTFPQQAQDILLRIGGWLATNGEAIYGTRPWKIYGEGPTQVQSGSMNDTSGKPFTSADIRFTTKGEVLYAIAMTSPSDGRLAIKSLADGSGLMPARIKTVQLLGADASVPWERTSDALTLRLPAATTKGYPVAIKIIPDSTGAPVTR